MTGNSHRNVPRKRKIIRMGTLNVSTLRDKEEEMIEMMKERNLDVLGMCETRMKGEGEKLLHDNYKLIYSGRDDGQYGVAFMMTPSFAERVDSVRRGGERILNISVKLGTEGMDLVQVYVPQSGRPTE